MLAPSKADGERLIAFLERGQPDAALSLLQENLTHDGIDVDSARSLDGKCLIHIASEKGYGAIVLELLHARASIDARDPSFCQRSALLIAAFHNHSDLVEILLAKGADFSLRDENGMDVIALAGSLELRERIVRLVGTNTSQLKTEVETKPDFELTSTPSPLCPRTRNIVVTPVQGFSAIKEQPTEGTSQAIVLAAVETANAFVSPKERWRKVFNIFKAVQTMGASQKQLAAFRGRLIADPSLASARATGGTVRDGSTLLHAAADWGNIHSLTPLLRKSTCFHWSTCLSAAPRWYCPVGSDHSRIGQRPSLFPDCIQVQKPMHQRMEPLKHLLSPFLAIRVLVRMVLPKEILFVLTPCGPTRCSFHLLKSG